MFVKLIQVGNRLSKLNEFWHMYFPGMAEHLLKISLEREREREFYLHLKHISHTIYRNFMQVNSKEKILLSQLSTLLLIEKTYSVLPLQTWYNEKLNNHTHTNTQKHRHNRAFQRHLRISQMLSMHEISTIRNAKLYSFVTRFNK